MTPFLYPNTITVSGGVPPLVGIPFPSALIPGNYLCALLSSANATFGFNLTRHRLDTEWIPCGESIADFFSASGNLPPVGATLELEIQNFYFKGFVSHADYTTSSAGTVVKITLEDHRDTLQQLKIHSEDLGTNVPSGVASIARAYRVNEGLNDNEGNPSDALIKEYRRILEFGGTYSQILDAVDLAYTEGKAHISSDDLPSISQIELNIGGDVESLRFQFNLTTLDQAITRVLQDSGYDWYWNMSDQKINLINKKVIFNLEETAILDLISSLGGTSGLIETKQVGFGLDLLTDPTRFRVLGGHQEGIVNSKLLSQIDGLDTTKFDNRIVFRKAWSELSIGFFDNNGYYRTYTPTEIELQLALAGIEQWTYFKIYQTASINNNPPGFDLPPDDGSIAAQHPTFQSRYDPLMPIGGLADGAAESGIRIISNRRDEEHNWVIAFYNRVRDHASRHYGRSYVLENFAFNEASGLFRVIDAAWANIENQVEGYPLSPSGAIDAIFTEDYEINRDLGPVSPFLTDDFRVAAHVVLPSGTVYGPQGDDVPASFGNWTEDAPPFNPTGQGEHYVPVTLTPVGQRVINPRNEEDLYAFESYPDGTVWCQLPINAGNASGLVENNVISSLSTLLTLRNRLNASGLRDIINPAIVLNAYDQLSGVAIPVESRLRYGQLYPSQWFAGSIDFQRGEGIQLDDQFVPWAFSPQGTQTSIDTMTERAFNRAIGKIVPQNSSRYADLIQVGMPLIGFDNFALQGIGPSGLYGEISHGINEMSITFSIDGYTTRYKIQSYFPQFGREAPLGERNRAILNGILNPIDFTDLALLNANPLPPINNSLPGDPGFPDVFFSNEQNAIRVTITEVNNLFTIDSTPGTEEAERYRGLDTHGYEKPPTLPSSNPDFVDGAICIDGFLNVDDEALYHTDQFELPDGTVVLRYFTQGRPFGNGTIVEIERPNVDNSSLYDVTIVEDSLIPTSERRALFGLSVLNGRVTEGDRTTLAVQGDAIVSPGPTPGNTIFLNGTVTPGGVPVEIQSISNQGLTTARATCRILDYNGTVSATGQQYSNVIPIPYAQFAAVGDRGFLINSTVPSGVSVAQVDFLEIVKPGFFRL